jgi:hypothetical protein
MNMSADELRRWAARCEADAEKTQSLEDRDRLLRMQTALLSLAEGEDWLMPGQQERNGATMANGGRRRH